MIAPNHLSKNAIDAFKAAYEAEFHERLSDEEVREIALNLLRFFELIRRAR
ncbi:MAG TPA: hypothetical protein VK530_15275 [Candidatus Acidoferrum sp.]|nr:hypothetical protein [Candidatus Acidoferrum sp.]